MASISGPRKVLTDAEEKVMEANDLASVLRTEGLLREEEVRKLSVGELKKMGLGRTPTGEFSVFGASVVFLMCFELRIVIDPSVRFAGYCYSSRMTLHQPINDSDHPEKPSRIVGVFGKLSSTSFLLPPSLPFSRTHSRSHAHQTRV